MNQFNPGDMVFASVDLYNDPMEDSGESAIPGIAANELLASAGARGVVVNAGHVEADPTQAIYLVRFESAVGGTLGEPIGCLAEELHQDAAG